VTIDGNKEMTKCDVCGRAAEYSSQLRKVRHSRAETPGEKSMLRVCAQKQKKTFWKYNFIQHMTEKHLNEAQERLHTIESCQQVYRRSGRNHFVENKIFASVFFPHTISQQNLTNNSVTNSIPHNTYYYPEL
jgi:hypothetical protein